jgi:YesN/AraC family two-component response regulator
VFQPLIQKAQADMTQPGSSPTRKLRVLIADDIQETRRNTRLMLSLISDVEVVAIASNGLQAVQMAKEQHPDIVVLDINMPEMNGLAAFKEIAKNHPDTGCIIISAEKDSEILRMAMSLGIRDYLFKPFTVDQMEQAVGKVAARLVQKRQQMRQTDQLRQKNEAYLKQLANEYSISRRTDLRAVEVYEQLAANPACELRWLRTLAMIYVIRQEWGNLKSLAARLEQQENKIKG